MEHPRQLLSRPRKHSQRPVVCTMFPYFHVTSRPRPKNALAGCGCFQDPEINSSSSSTSSAFIASKSSLFATPRAARRALLCSGHRGTPSGRAIARAKIPRSRLQTGGGDKAVHAAVSPFVPPRRRCLASRGRDLSGWSADLSERRRPTGETRLPDPCAAALNQQNQHDDKQNAGDNCIIVVLSMKTSFLHQSAACAPSVH